MLSNKSSGKGRENVRGYGIYLPTNLPALLLSSPHAPGEGSKQEAGWMFDCWPGSAHHRCLVTVWATLSPRHIRLSLEHAVIIYANQRPQISAMKGLICGEGPYKHPHRRKGLVLPKSPKEPTPQPEGPRKMAMAPAA